MHALRLHPDTTEQRAPVSTSGTVKLTSLLPRANMKYLLMLVN